MYVCVCVCLRVKKLKETLLAVQQLDKNMCNLLCVCVCACVCVSQGEEAERDPAGGAAAG